MTSIAENIALTLTRIREAETRFQRESNSVCLMAVSKTRPAEDIREAFGHGQRHFGENYLQDALDKIEKLQALDICWHFIGPVQSNKASQVAEYFDWVHSVDRIKIARRLNDRRPADMAPLNLCIQVNISNEFSKSGVAVNEVADFMELLCGLDRLCVRGLMAIPKAGMNEQQQRQTFAQLKTLFEQLKVTHPQLDTLSMGMSQDMDSAIAEGSTIVRIGTAIFGARH
ncbi:MAG: YggS family pyridoxal phosphate-dependent enzyme [Motiliproteus sp.]